LDSKIHVGTGIGTLCLAMQRSNIPSSAVDPDPQNLYQVWFGATGYGTGHISHSTDPNPSMNKQKNKEKS
jgi:hypothetical protein